MEDSAPYTADPAAYRFEAPAPALAPPADDARKSRTFAGVAYSGEPIQHWAFGQLVIDLDSLSLAANTPILLEHDRGKRVGVGTLAVRDGALHADGRLLRNPDAQALASDADDGFPWQMSVHADPGSIEEVQPGTQAAINGRTFTGPLTIFRQTRIRELSFTPTGYDHRTSAAVMSTPPPGASTPMHEDSTMPTVDELQAQLSGLSDQVAQLTADRDTAAKRAEAAEAKLTQQARTARLSAVTDTFAQLGKQITEADAAPYLAMDDATWQRVAADLAAVKPRAPDHLFSEQATDGPPANSGADTIARLAAI